MSFLLYLAQKGLFREEDIPEISAQVEHASGGLDEVLEKGGMTGDQIGSLKAECYGIEARSLADHKVPAEVLKLVPEESARHYQIAPLGTGKRLVVAPESDRQRMAIEDATGGGLELVDGHGLRAAGTVTGAERERMTVRTLPPAADDYSFAAQVLAQGVTHLQCTPSMARMYCTAA